MKIHNETLQNITVNFEVYKVTSKTNYILVRLKDKKRWSDYRIKIKTKVKAIELAVQLIFSVLLAKQRKKQLAKNSRQSFLLRIYITMIKVDETEPVGGELFFSKISWYFKLKVAKKEHQSRWYDWKMTFPFASKRLKAIAFFMENESSQSL